MPVEILHRGDSWQATTQDVGPGGCLVSSPRALVTGTQLRLVLRSAAVPEALNVAGNVAWARDALGGVAFTIRPLGFAPRPDRWFQRLLDARPGLANGIGRAPDRLALDAPLYLLPPPRLVDLTADEEALLYCSLDGKTVGGLLSSAAVPEDRAARALFSLFEKGVLTLSLGRAGEGWKWRAVLRGERHPAEAERAPGAGERGASSPHAPRIAPATTAPLDAALLRGAGATRRPPEAQARLDEARAAAEASRIDQAVALLRQALSLAPRDAEISRLLGQLAFKDRRL